MGFFPAPEEAITELVKHLVAINPEEKGDFYILDPCACEGAAIAQIAEGLLIPQSHVYCIELDDKRGTAIRERVPQAHVLSPCAFDSALIGWVSFGLIYCNPPYDFRLGGGGREWSNAPSGNRLWAAGFQAIASTSELASKSGGGGFPIPSAQARGGPQTSPRAPMPRQRAFREID
jgi:hypothetical protein